MALKVGAVPRNGHIVGGEDQAAPSVEDIQRGVVQPVAGQVAQIGPHVANQVDVVEAVVVGRESRGQVGGGGRFADEDVLVLRGRVPTRIRQRDGSDQHAIRTVAFAAFKCIDTIPRPRVACVGGVDVGVFAVGHLHRAMEFQGFEG